MALEQQHLLEATGHHGGRAGRVGLGQVRIVRSPRTHPQRAAAAAAALIAMLLLSLFLFLRLLLWPTRRRRRRRRRRHMVPR